MDEILYGVFLFFVVGLFVTGFLFFNLHYLESQDQEHSNYMELALAYNGSETETISLGSDFHGNTD